MMRCKHNDKHSDAAKATAANVNMHYQAIGWDAVGKWTAIHIQDGSSDNTLYEHRKEAVNHQHHNEQYYAFVKIVPSLMEECEAEIFLEFHRKAYDAGFRLADPEHKKGGRELIMRGRAQEIVASQLQSFGIRTVRITRRVKSKRSH